MYYTVLISNLPEPLTASCFTPNILDKDDKGNPIKMPDGHMKTKRYNPKLNGDLQHQVIEKRTTPLDIYKKLVQVDKDTCNSIKSFLTAQSAA